jgi:hypothetical protein
MDKTSTLEAMQNARKSHLSQMEKIAAVINGEKVNKPTALNHTECNFGKWLYADENRLKSIFGALFFNNLEEAHTQWHREYERIYNIFFKDQKKSFFSKSLTPAKVSSLEIDKAKLYYSELEVTTAEVLRILGSCERRVRAMSDTKFR